MADRRERLAGARLYLVCDARPDAFVKLVLAAGVDIVQLRMKGAADQELIAVARRYARICAAEQKLLILNDRPDLVREVGADGAHVGQDDMSVSQARALVGEQRLVGLSTHTPAQIDEAGSGVDYLGVGPVYRTPTKPGRPAVGLGLVRYAASHAGVPFFAIGGINTGNVAVVHRAGARRVAVVRALTGAADPATTARELRARLNRELPSEVSVGAA